MRAAVYAAFSLGLIVSLTGCPPEGGAIRDGGTHCSSSSDCNPAGQVCGALRLCVARFCTDTTVSVVCADGGFSSDVVVGNCGNYEDCNPTRRCGFLVPCVNYTCDTTAPPISVACPDARD